MAKPRIKWRVKGFEELRYTAGVRRELARRADAVAAACLELAQQMVASQESINELGKSLQQVYNEI